VAVIVNSKIRIKWFPFKKKKSKNTSPSTGKVRYLGTDGCYYPEHLVLLNVTQWSWKIKIAAYEAASALALYYPTLYIIIIIVIV